MRTVCLLYGCQCNACCERIARALRRVNGVRHVTVSLYKATAIVEHDESCSCQDVIAAVERLGYLATVAPNPRRPSDPAAEEGG